VVGWDEERGDWACVCLLESLGMGHDWKSTKYDREECVRLTLFRSDNFVSFGWKEEKPKIWVSIICPSIMQ
jgi:hypothetical protein